MGTQNVQWTIMLLFTTTLLIQTNESFIKTNDDETNGRQTDDNRNILTYHKPILAGKEESSNADVANPINKENESALKSLNNKLYNASNFAVNYNESNSEKIADSDIKGKLVLNKTNQYEEKENANIWDSLENSTSTNQQKRDLNRDKTKTNKRLWGININKKIDLNIDKDDEIAIETLDDEKATTKSTDKHIYLNEKTVDDAVHFGIETVENLVQVKEPMWYKMGLFLDDKDPASKVAAFGAPRNSMAIEVSRWGFLTLEASRKLAESFPENGSRQAAEFPGTFHPRLLQDDCPLKGVPRCPHASRRYRTPDGTCNHLKEPWKGSAMLPMQRFLPPTYNDGIQSVRRSVFGSRLPSARDISAKIHRDNNREIPTVTLMFMQWGQLIDHDVTSVVKSRSFEGAVPRCCAGGGRQMLPPELLHPSCLPIEVSQDDAFLGQFGVRCMEFIRSAPSTRINCDLGWREQINQVTPYIDASEIYGSDIETSNSVRTFRNGNLIYGRPRNQAPLQPPDPPGGELCRSGALTEDCFQSGDGRASEQPGLTAFHTVWIRFHNKIATVLSRLNPHWSDEKAFQETRRIVYSFIQHITYREFLPIVLGPEVMELFELNLVRNGYYNKYQEKVDPAIANSFSAAAFRFGHSMVQNSFVRFDHKHRPLFNNVTLHEELDNIENIWSFGSLDRLLLGFANQPSQRRDEFVCDELSNHLFQPPGVPFGMDLSAINIQRGRDHGVPSYTSWRQPCGLSPVGNWKDLERIFNLGSVPRFQSLYRHVDDIDLFSGGLAEKPVRGGVVGPTFACIIAQQFLNLRKGDRFWYENGGFDSSFTPAQLQQIRRASFAYVLCQTTDEIETIQPFVFLSPDEVRNIRLPCNDPAINNFDMSPWVERFDFDNEIDDFPRNRRQARLRNRTSKPKTKKKKTTAKPSKTITNVTKYGGGNVIINSIPPRPYFSSYQQQQQQQSDMNYLLDLTKTTTPSPTYFGKPVEVNIKIQYFLPATEQTTPPSRKKKKPTPRPTDAVLITQRPSTNKPQLDYPLYLRPQSLYVRPNDLFDKPTTKPRPNDYIYRPTNGYSKPSYDNTGIDSYFDPVFEDRPFSTSKRPYVYKPQSNHYVYTTKRPQQVGYGDETFFDYTRRPTTINGYNNRDDTIDDVYSQLLNENDRIDDIPNKPSFGQYDFTQPTKRPNTIYTIGQVHKLDDAHDINDKLDFKTRLVTKYRGNSNDDDRRFVKISSVKAGAFIGGSTADFYTVQKREGETDLNQVGGDGDGEDVRIVEIDVAPSEVEDKHWLVYNATEEAPPLPPLPEITVDGFCSDELPKPINPGKALKNRRRGL